jgi:hypothetical protein
MRMRTRHRHASDTERADRSAPTYPLVGRWAWTDAAVAGLGLALALLGIGALVRTDVGGWVTWLLAVWVLIVSAVALTPPRRGRVERVVETH